MNNTETVQELSPELELPVGQAPNPGKLEDVLDTRTPAEIEAAMLKQAEDDATKAAKNRDPAQTAAIFFHLFFPEFQRKVMFLSNKELRRLVVSIVGKGHQTMPDVPTFKDKNAGAAYKLALELQQAKFMMVQGLELEALQKEHDAEAAKLAAEATVSTEFGEKANEV